MNDTESDLPRPVADPANPAWRLLALVYDLFPVIALLAVVSLLFLALNGGRTVERRPLLAAAMFATQWLVAGAYFVVSWRRGGQTIGMRPWRLRLVGSDGQPAATGRLWLRYAVAMLTPVFGWAWALFDGDRRALYDLAAGTAFVRLRPAPKS